MAKSQSNRIITTPTSYAKKHYLYVQEVGTLQSIEPHISRRQSLNSYLFLVILEGKGILTYGANKYTLAAGDCAFIDCQKNYSHESSAENPWKLIWVHFSGEQASSFYEQYTFLGKKRIFKPMHISSFLDCLNSLYEIQQKSSPLSEIVSHKYLTDIITLCFSENEQFLSIENSFSEKLEKVYTYINSNFQRKLSLDILSDTFFISKFHLSREFKKAYGITIIAALTNKRISHAKSLLRFTKQSMESIAADCGFSDSAYFIKVFKHAEGMTPLEYRKKW